MGKFEDAEEWIEAELNETLDEMFEAEFSEPILSKETREYIKKIYRGKKPKALENRVYFKNLLKLEFFLSLNDILGFFIGHFIFKSLSFQRIPASYFLFL